LSLISLKSIRFLNADIHYSIYGEGPAVMLLHGFAEDSRIWDNQINSLTHNYKLIIPDIPGSGRSELIIEENVSLTTYAEIIRSILENENIKSCILLGHSMGGYISLAFAEKYPEKLSALGFIHSSTYADNNEKVASRKKAIDFIKKNGSYLFLKNSIPEVFHDALKNKEQIETLIERGRDFQPESLIQYHEAMIKRSDSTQMLKKIRIPVLWQIGKHDNFVPFYQNMQQCYLAETNEVHILKNSAHMGMVEEAEKTSQIIGSFLANVHI